MPNQGSWVSIDVVAEHVGIVVTTGQRLGMEHRSIPHA